MSEFKQSDFLDEHRQDNFTLPSILHLLFITTDAPHMCSQCILEWTEQSCERSNFFKLMGLSTWLQWLCKTYNYELEIIDSWLYAQPAPPPGYLATKVIAHELSCLSSWFPKKSQTGEKDCGVSEWHISSDEIYVHNLSMSHMCMYFGRIRKKIGNTLLFFTKFKCFSVFTEDSPRPQQDNCVSMLIGVLFH